MINETKKNIEAYKAMLPGLKERVAAVALMLVMSIVMMTSASYAWLTISRAPEVQGMNTTITGNGNLEIALADGTLIAPGDSQVGDSSATPNKDLLDANITWGNLVNLSDSRYGLEQISLRPARFNSYNTTVSPLRGVSYGKDGRVTGTNENYEFASYQETKEGSGEYYFAAGSAVKYGVRAISSVKWSTTVANKEIEDMTALAMSAYEDENSGALNIYMRILNGTTLVDTTRKISCMDALEMLMNIYVNEKAEKILNDNDAYQADYSSVVTYTYRLMVEFMKVIEAEGEGLRQLANIQAYAQSADNGTDYFETIDDLLAANYSWLQLESLTTYKTSRANLQKSIDNLKTLAELYDPDTGTGTDPVYWSSISPSVSNLVDIGTTEINGTPLSNLGGTAASKLALASKIDVIIYKGALRDTEQRLSNLMWTMGTKMTVTVDAFSMDKTASVYTDAEDPFTSTIDLGYTKGLQPAKNSGTATAKDTYGVALDFWVRTNALGTVLTLEGNIETTEQTATIDVSGGTYVLYNMTYSTTVDGELVSTVTEVYQIDSIWYNAISHTQIGTADELTSENGYSFTEKKIEVVTGYDGVNRVWEDFQKLISDGNMAENNTTQGAGSCYVFYADPSEQTRILELLQVFSIEFIDQNGNSYGTAVLDTEHAYAINGKVTVPLKMSSGAVYLDEDGNEQLGIVALEQNEPTWITAIIYLDGLRMSNEDVLAVGNIEGSLNLQFGSSEPLNNQDDEELRNQYRDITATAAGGGKTSSNSSQIISYTYDGTAKSVTVTLEVDGEQPKTISGFFLRAISATQGTRGEKVAFTRTGDVWTATFTLTKPGTYVMRNLIVDGVEYALEDGTGKDTNGNIKPENFPTVVIEGMQVTSVETLPGSGTVMTAESFKEIQVTANIAVDPSLLPEQVRAVFRRSDGKEVSAVMSYELQSEFNNTAQWTGTAKITESGSYTLEYIVIDGDFTLLESSQQTKLEVYLGLTAQVWYAGESNDTFAFDGTTVSFEYDGTTKTVPVKMKLYDSNGSEMRALTDVELYYGLAGDTNGLYSLYAGLTWNASTGYYEGAFEVETSGTFQFDYVNVMSGSILSTINRVASSPIIEAIVTDPPVYDYADTVAQQYKPNPATDPAKLSVVMTNAHTAKVVAQIKNVDTGSLHMVEMIAGDYTPLAGNQYKLNFVVPNNTNGTQDGNWQLMALYFQKAADPDKNWYPITTETPDATNSYVIDVQDQNIVTDVVGAVYINITDMNGAVLSTVELGSKTDATLAPFMKEFYTGQLKITITDGAGRSVADYTDGTTPSIVISYDSGSDDDYGGYDDAEMQNITVYLKKVDAGNGSYYFTMDSQTLPFAGKYSTTLSYSIFGTAGTSYTGPTFEVSTVKPTVTISAVTPGTTASIPTRITWTKNWRGALSYTLSENKTNVLDTANNVVTVYAKASTGSDAEGVGNGDAGFVRPQLTFTAGGIDSSTKITFTIPKGDATNDVNVTLTGTAGGTYTLGSTAEVYSSWSVYTYSVRGYFGHGDQTISTITLTKDGVSYTVTLDKPIVIHNPSSVNKTS